MSNRGIWATVDTSNGLVGPVFHLSPVSSGSITTAADQACAFNNAGLFVIQGNVGVRCTYGTTGVVDLTHDGSNAKIDSVAGHLIVRANASNELYLRGGESGGGINLDALGDAAAGVVRVRTRSSGFVRLICWNGSGDNNGAAVSIGRAANNDTEAEAAAGLVGPLLNIAPISGGTLTTAANQALFYNSGGSAVVQGDAGVWLQDGIQTVLAATYDVGSNSSILSTQSGINFKVAAFANQPLTLQADGAAVTCDGIGTAGFFSVRTTNSLYNRVVVWNGNGVAHGSAISFGNIDNNDSESEAAAGLVGTILNIATMDSGSLTSTSNQATIHNNAGSLNCQGHAGFKAIVNTTTKIEANATGVGFYATAPVAKQTITGALSTVADAPAKAVLTSIIAALVAYGLAIDGTT